MSDPYEEILEGDLCLRLGPGERHELICQRLHERVAAALKPDSITRKLECRTDIRYSPDAIVRPDLSLVTAATNKIWLAAEIINSGDHSADTVIKKGLYEQHGLPRLWMVDPRYNNVEIYHGGRHGLVLQQILAVNEVLTESLLPGFEFVISELFQED